MKLIEIRLSMTIVIPFFFSFGATAPSGPGPPHARSF